MAKRKPNKVEILHNAVLIKAYGKDNYHDVVVSLEDWDKVKEHTWSVFYNKPTKSFYAYTNLKKNGKRKQVLLSRFLTDCPKDFEADHINHDTLDNRRENLRVVTHQVNCENRKDVSTSRNRFSKFRGVSWHPRDKVWCASVKYKGKSVWCGSYQTEEEARQAVEKKRAELFQPIFLGERETKDFSEHKNE